MLRFFRQIRQHLLVNDKTGKYFKYALGEIILVVIGILIALQINNWNEERKAIQQENTYYCKLSEDFQSDIVNIDSSLVTNALRMEKSKTLLSNLLKVQKDKDVILKDFVASFRGYRFIPSKAAIVDITSSGKLEKLTNQDLKNNILSHYTFQDNAMSIMDINYNAIIDRLFAFNNYADFGYQEIPRYQILFGEELRTLLTSKPWHQNPNDDLFRQVKDMMILNIIHLDREQELLNKIKEATLQLNNLLIPYCGK